MIGGFALFVLWMVGLVASSVELWGSGGVQSNCNLQVFNQNPHGKTMETMAWLQQKTICTYLGLPALTEERGSFANTGMNRSNVVPRLCHGLDWRDFPDLGHDYGISGIRSVVRWYATLKGRRRHEFRASGRASQRGAP